MDDDELDELLLYVRLKVVEIGRADLDSQVWTSLLGSEERGSHNDLLYYLDGVRSEFYLGSRAFHDRVLNRFEGVETESGRRIDGVMLDLSPAGQRSLEGLTVELTGSRELDGVVAGLDQLMASLRESDQQR